MKLSLFTDYALRVLIHLGREPDRRVAIADIGAAHDISRNHLGKVVQRLEQAGHVNTFRGRGGGLELAVPARDLRIGVLVEEMENLDLVECFSADGRCPLTGRCTLQVALEQARSAFLDALNRYTLADLLVHGNRPVRLPTPPPRR